MSENSVKNESVKRRPRWLVPLVAGACIVALAGGVTGGVIAWRDGNARALADAQSKCEGSLAKVGKARAAYSKTVEGAGDVKAVKAEQVADAKVVSALASELDVEAPKTLACNAADADGLNATAGKLDAQVKWYATHEASVKTASENVSKSRDEKTLADARKALSDKEGTARKLLKDSDGKTSDNAARAQLTQAINTAVEAGKGTDTRKMSEAGSELDKATKSVNDAISAKQKADAAAAAAANASRSQSSPPARPGRVPAIRAGTVRTATVPTVAGAAIRTPGTGPVVPRSRPTAGITRSIGIPTAIQLPRARVRTATGKLRSVPEIR